MNASRRKAFEVLWMRNLFTGLKMKLYKYALPARKVKHHQQQLLTFISYSHSFISFSGFYPITFLHTFIWNLQSTIWILLFFSLLHFIMYSTKSLIGFASMLAALPSAFAGFSSSSSNSVAIYWGQGPNQGTLASYCSSKTLQSFIFLKNVRQNTDKPLQMPALTSSLSLSWFLSTS